MKNLRLLAIAASVCACALGWSQSAALQMTPPPDTKTATPLGPKTPTDLLHIAVALPCADPAGFQAFVDSVSNPANTNYRQFLTPPQVGQRFGVSSSNLKSVISYLSSQGMHVTRITQNRMTILADATVAQAEAAFQTSIANFTQTDPTTGVVSARFSFTKTPSVPTAIRPFVQYVDGMENFSQPTAEFSLTPAQLQTLYSLAPSYQSGFQGAGRTVAITNFVDYGLQNIPLEYAQFGLPTPPGGVGSNVRVVSIAGHNGNVTSGAPGECDLDIQCVLNMAPLCNLIVYDDANGSDYLALLAQEADDNAADIVTESYGHHGNNASTWLSMHNEFLTMSAQGMTYMSGAGDMGTAGLVTNPYPKIDPEVLTVGGTTVSVDSSGNRISEVVWDDPGAASTGKDIGGGGYVITSDTFNVLPSYQVGYGVPTTVPYRLVPDVALDADPKTGYQIFLNGIFEPSIGVSYGGCSAAGPTMAGMIADCEQQIIAGGGLTANSSGKQRMGRMQDLIYSYNGNSSVFFDVVSGTNGSLPNGDESLAGPGWDTASGWGTMIFSGFVNKVLNLPTLQTVSMTPNPVTGGVSSVGTVTLSSPAPSAGTTVSLSSSSTGVQVPTTAMVLSGATTATFPITTTPVAQTTQVTITGKQGGQTVTATLTVNPPSVSSVTLTQPTIVGGNATTGTVTLSGPTPVNGMTVTLSSNSVAAIVQSSVLVRGGATSATFPIVTDPVSSMVTATIQATGGGESASATLTVTPVSLASVTVMPSSVVGGAPSLGTVTLAGPAPSGGALVSLASSVPSAATVPSTVKIAAGARLMTFPIATSVVSTQQTPSITATYGSTSQSATLDVNPITVSSIALKPATVAGGASSTATITISSAPPKSGLTVSISSNASSAIVPATLKISGKKLTATFTIKTKTVAALTQDTISATLGSSPATATLTITAPTIKSLSLSPSSLVGGKPSNGTVTISAAAPAGGITINLASSNAIAAPPTTVTIPAGKTSVKFSITTLATTAQQAATITATLGPSTKSANLTVKK